MRKRVKAIFSVITALSLLTAALPAVFAATAPESLGATLVGDANTDGSVTLKDATSIQKHLAAVSIITGVGLLAADTDGNKEVTLKDATSIQKYLAGVITVFPAGVYVDEGTTQTTTILLGNTVTINGPGATTAGQTVTINAAGTYEISGTLTQGSVIVNTTDAVSIILAGVNITNPTGPALYIKHALNAVITLKDSTSNTLKDGTANSSTDTKGTLFSNDPLELCGTGSLSVQSVYKHGIVSDDNILISGGKITVTGAVKDGLHANDDITITGGTVNLTATSDGIESEGTITINGGTLNISAGDDGIHAETAFNIKNGTINVTNSYEGLESKTVLTIDGGTIRLKCSDDAINTEQNLIVNGGYIYCDCGGDGYDSNGNMTINGGTNIVFASNTPNGPLDIGDRGYTLNMNGGIVIASGGNMGISSANTSTQYSVWIYKTLNANTIVNLSSTTGSNEIVSFKLPKACASIVISSPKLSGNTSYTAYSGGSHTGTLTDYVYSGGKYTSGTSIGSVTTSAKSVNIGKSGGGPM